MPKEVTDMRWMKNLLLEEDVGHLALADGDQPYVVPVNYAYIDDMIVLHGAIKGLKLDILAKNSRCCFAVNRHPDKVRYHAEGKCHYRYHSVLVYGRAFYVDSAEERLVWIRKYRRYFNARLGNRMKADDTIKTAERCGIILVEIDRMTARKEEKKKADIHEDE